MFTQEIYEIDPRLASEATFKAKFSEILYHRCLTFLETMGIVCKRIVSVRGHSRAPKDSPGQSRYLRVLLLARCTELRMPSSATVFAQSFWNKNA